MARTLEQIEADIAALRAAHASGVSRVRYADGREVLYRSMADLERALRALEAERDAAEPAPLRVATRYVSGLY